LSLSILLYCLMPAQRKSGRAKKPEQALPEETLKVHLAGSSNSHELIGNRTYRNPESRLNVLELGLGLSRKRRGRRQYRSLPPLSRGLKGPCQSARNSKNARKTHGIRHLGPLHRLSCNALKPLVESLRQTLSRIQRNERRRRHFRKPAENVLCEDDRP
jgi:hypothetical protein